jgi:Na+/proline symporter
MTTTFYILGAFVIVGFLIEGVRGRSRSSTAPGLFIRDGNLDLGPFVGSLAATNFSLGNMIYLSLIWGYFYGFPGIIWLWVGFILAAIIYIYYVKNMKPISDYINDESNSGSIHEYLGQRYDNNNFGKKVRILASTTTIACLLFALTLEIHLTSVLGAKIIDGNPRLLFIVITGLVCAYSALGGFWAVVSTDIIQGILLSMGAASLLAIGIWSDISISSAIPRYSENYGSIIDSIFSPGLVGIVSIIGVTVVWYLVTMDTWQRHCAGRSSSKASDGMYYGTVILIIGILLFGLVGVYDRLAVLPALSGESQELHSGGYNPLTDLLLIVDQIPMWGDILLGAVFVAFVTAGISTADTFLIVCGHSLVSDLLIGVGRNTKFGNLSHEESKLFSDIGRSIIIGMGVFIISVYFLLVYLNLLSNPLLVFYLAYSIQFALSAAVVLSTSKYRPSGKNVFWSIMFGLFVSIVWGFGFAISGEVAAVEDLGLTVSDAVYLTPVPVIVSTFIVTIIPFSYNIYTSKTS